MSRVVRFASFGSPEVLEVVEEELGEPGLGEVRVRMRAAGLNPVDSKIRRGGDAYPTILPSGLGRELAGTVESTGPGVQTLAAGDEVFGTIPGGALADSVIAAESFFAFKPAALPWDVAGGLALAGQTAWDALASQKLQAGDTIVVSASAGGVGSILSQLAHREGIRVIGSASSRNHGWLRSRGIEPVEYGDGFVATVRDLAPDGITAAFDLAGGDTVRQFIELGVPRDRINTNAMGADTPEGVQRVGRGPTSLATLATLAAIVIDGAVEVPIAASFSLDEIQAAFTFLDTGHLRGKVIVRGRDD
ncbi:MAG TPA: NADP-dependent oxidoreductase [Pseudolysinimonas sp.]|nr:NADP-dependent oxidoreductase [Pseudolysinimonas sp.]